MDRVLLEKHKKRLILLADADMVTDEIEKMLKFGLIDYSEALELMLRISEDDDGDLGDELDRRIVRAVHEVERQEKLN